MEPAIDDDPKRPSLNTVGRPVLVPQHPDRPSVEGQAAAGKKVFLHAGQAYASKKPACVVTVLSSSVGVCLFAPSGKIGGMTHYQLPGAAWQKRKNLGGGYLAIKDLVQGMRGLSTSEIILTALIFGGSRLSSRAARSGSSGSGQDLGSAQRAHGRAAARRTGHPGSASRCGRRASSKNSFFYWHRAVFSRHYCRGIR